MKTIILTGGGTAGHVNPNIALVDVLKKNNYTICYIGGHKGIEKDLLKREDLESFFINAGKLRRYISKDNFIDIFNVIKGFVQSLKIIKNIKPIVIFSKGGFVTVPVLFAAKLCRVPFVVHESDLTPGLANRLCIPMAKAVCVSFPETLELVDKKKAFLTGLPVRDELLNGDRDRGLRLCGFKKDKPILLVMGGSLGSLKINNSIAASLKELLKKYQVVHICGKNNLNPKLINIPGYKQFEYVNESMADIYAITDIVCARAGANSIHEFVALKKPALLIPLSKNSSRGDQIDNAKSFCKRKLCTMLYEKDLTGKVLVQKLSELYEKRQYYIDNMMKARIDKGIDEVIQIIERVTLNSSNRKHYAYTKKAPQ